MYDVNTGKRRFSFRGINSDVVGSPIVVGDDIYVTYRTGLLYSLNLKETEVLFYSRLYRLKIQLWIWDMMGFPGLPKGVQWAIRVGGTQITTPTTDGDFIYVASQEGRLSKIDRHTGKREWVTNLETPRLSGPTLVDGVLLVGDHKGIVHGISAEDGSEMWSMPVATSATSTPVVAGDTLYLTSLDGTLYAVE
jgi:hypothetical protein